MRLDGKLHWGLAALVVAGNMIGSGVYLLPATLATTGSSSLIGWVVAGIGAVTLALVFAALGICWLNDRRRARNQPDWENVDDDEASDIAAPDPIRRPADVAASTSLAEEDDAVEPDTALTGADDPDDASGDSRSDDDWT